VIASAIDLAIDLAIDERCNGKRLSAELRNCSTRSGTAAEERELQGTR